MLSFMELRALELFGNEGFCTLDRQHGWLAPVASKGIAMRPGLTHDVR